MNPNPGEDAMLQMSNVFGTRSGNDQLVRGYEASFNSFKEHLAKEPAIVGNIVADETVKTYVRPVERGEKEKIPDIGSLGIVYAKKKLKALLDNPKARDSFTGLMKEHFYDDGRYSFPGGVLIVSESGYTRSISFIDENETEFEVIDLGPSD